MLKSITKQEVLIKSNLTTDEKSHFLNFSIN